VVASTAYRALKRHRLGTRQQRFGLLEQHGARKAGHGAHPTPASPGPCDALLPPRRSLAARRARLLGLLLHRPAEGRRETRPRRLAGHGWSWATRERVSAAFLREVAAEFDRLGWPLRVLTDGASEFKGSSTRPAGLSGPDTPAPGRGMPSPTASSSGSWAPSSTSPRPWSSVGTTSHDRASSNARCRDPRPHPQRAPSMTADPSTGLRQRTL
jgi:hypothetical protein